MFTNKDIIFCLQEYRCTAVLGIETDTYNQDGRITDRKPYGVCVYVFTALASQKEII